MYIVRLRAQGTTGEELIQAFVDDTPVVNRFKTMSDIPAKTPVSEAMAKDMKARGFRFFGPTIAYAHMQAMGLVNDHVMSCFRWPEVQQA